MDKEQLAIARLQDAARLSEHRYKKPLMVTYSGGKDSQVLVALAERAGINFEVVNSHTTADAPETVYFIREQFKAMEERGIKCSIVMPRYKDKPVSMWTLIPMMKAPPTRNRRYCCSILKESPTMSGCFIATGVRWAESVRRNNTRGIMEISHINPLYQCGFERVGCVGCPLGGYKHQCRDFARYPKFKEAYIRAFQKMLDIRKERTMPNDIAEWKTGEDVFHWWMEDGVLPGQLSMDDLMEDNNV